MHGGLLSCNQLDTICGQIDSSKMPIPNSLKILQFLQEFVAMTEILVVHLIFLWAVMRLPFRIFCGHSSMSLNIRLLGLWFFVVDLVYFWFRWGASFSYANIMTGSSLRTAVKNYFQSVPGLFSEVRYTHLKHYILSNFENSTCR